MAGLPRTLSRRNALLLLGRLGAGAAMATGFPALTPAAVQPGKPLRVIVLGADIADTVAKEAPSGLYVLLDQLPVSQILVAGTVLQVAMFVITSANSATFILGMFTSKGVLNPTRFVRVFWGR